MAQNTSRGSGVVGGVAPSAALTGGTSAPRVAPSAALRGGGNKPLSINIPAAPASEHGGNQNFLGWLGDILSRPLYGVTNVLHDTVNSAVDQATGKKSLGDEFAANPLGGLGSFLSGMFSTNPDTHRSTSQLIEGTTDKIGSAVDPNYKNTQDNVNPWLKGIAGFVGDVALDPTTYIPGVGLLNLGSKSARSLASVEKAIKAEGDVQKATSKAADIAATPEAPSKASATQVVANKLVNSGAVDDIAPWLPTKMLDKAPKLQQANVQDKVLRAIVTPTAKGANKFLKGLNSDQVTSLAHTVADVSSHEPLSPASWLKELDTKFASMPQKELDKLNLPKVTYATGEKKTLGAALFDAAGAPDLRVQKMAKEALGSHYRNWYRANFQQSKSEGKLIDALTQPVKAESPLASGALETTTSAVDAYQRAHALDAERIQQYLGDKLTHNLKVTTNPAQFSQKLARLNGILDGTVDVSTLKKLQPAERMLLKHLGLEPDTLPIGFKAMRAEPNVAAPEHAVSNADAAAAGLSSDPMVRDYQSIAEKALKDTLHDQYVEPGKPFRSQKGALKSDQAYGSGSGMWQRQVTSQTWFTLMRAIDSQVSKRLGKLGGYARAMQSRQLFLNSLRLAERKMDDLGMPLTMGLNEDRYHMLPSQVIEHLDQVDPELMQRIYWNRGSALPHTALMDAVTAAIKGRVPLKDGALVEGNQAIRDALEQTKVKYTNADGTREFMGNNLKGIDSKGNPLGPAKYAARNGKTENLSREDLLNRAEALIRQEAPTLRNMAEENAKAVYARTQSEVMDLSDKAINDLRAVYENAQGPGDIIRGIEDISPTIKRNAAATGATDEAEKIAEQVTKEHIPADQTEAAASYSKQARNIEKSVDSSKAAPRQAVEEAVRANQGEARNRYHQDYLNEMGDQQFVPGGNTIDLGTEFHNTYNHSFLNRVRTVFDTAFNQPAFRDMVRSKESIWRLSLHDYQTGLHAIEKMPGATTDAIKQAWTAVANGVTPSDPAVAAIAEQLSKSIEQVFGRNGGGLLDSPYFREALSLEQANRGLDFYKAGFQFDLSGESSAKAIAQQWAKHNPDDPIEFLSKSYTAFSQSVMHQLIADQALEKARQIGALSKAPRPGWVRFADDTGKSTLAPYLPSDVYMHPALAHQLQVVDAYSRNLLERKGPVWEFVRDYYQPMLDMWKYGMTLPNPTHHFRNLWSDMSLTFLAQGAKGFRSAHNKALQVMVTHDGYDGYNFAKAIQGLGQDIKPGKVLTKSKFGDIGVNDYYSAAMDRGNLPTFRQLEQLGFEGEEGAGKLATKWRSFTDTKAVKKLGSVSEARDHYVRMAHFIQYVEQHANDRKIKSLEELFDKASEQVRKWHPDGSDLTNAERTFKLIIPFYSWTRHAIPLITEAVLTHPARVTAFNKASYALATTMGVNPNSLSDPWPADQTFPSYLTDQEGGPQFNIGGALFKINPGIAPWDVLNQTVGGNPLQNVVGQATPALRMPFEVATGTNAGTGGPILDWSDYADSQIPGIGQLSRVTGVSPTGTLKAILTGNGQIPQLQRQVAKGNKSPATGALNWLFGLGAQQVNTPSQIRSAQLEQRNNGGK